MNEELTCLREIIKISQQCVLTLGDYKAIVEGLKAIDLSKLTPGVPPEGYELAHDGAWQFVSGGKSALFAIPTPPPVPYSPQFGEMVRATLGTGYALEGKFIKATGNHYWIDEGGDSVPQALLAVAYKLTPILPEPAEPEVWRCPEAGDRVRHQNGVLGICAGRRDGHLVWLPDTSNTIGYVTFDTDLKVVSDPRKEKGGSQ